MATMEICFLDKDGEECCADVPAKRYCDEDGEWFEPDYDACTPEQKAQCDAYYEQCEADSDYARCNRMTRRAESGHHDA